MEEQIMVTIMITYYNQKEYIKDSLGSVLSQKTDFIYEIICGDDCSTDGTYEELIRWQHKYPDVISIIQMPRELEREYEPINRVSENRYNMWKRAKGKYVSFLDGDDYYTDNNKLQDQVSLLEENLDCVACGQPIMMVWEDKAFASQEISKISDHTCVIGNKHYWRDYWFHANTFVFRNVLEQNKENVNALYFDDNLITCYFIKYGNVIFSPKDTTAYRQIGNSSWNNRSNLQKAYVNMVVYCEGARITGWKMSSFVRCISAWKIIYDNRIDGVNLDKENKTIRDVLVNNKFVKDTILFRKMSFHKKAFYYLKYYIPVHLGIVFHIVKIIERTRFRKIDEN